MNNMPADKNRRVLVIDDNRAIHDDFRKILSPAIAKAAALDATEMAVFGHPTNVIQQTQFEVDSAYQGQEGVMLVQKAMEEGRPYAMAFVDIRMPPGWDGVETTQKIWAIDSQVQIVLCTAYSDYSWGEMFEKLGHHDGLLILKKPFDSVEALQLAYALTEKWWLHQQSQQKMKDLEKRVVERTHELQNINHTLQTEVIDHERAEETLRESEEKFRQLAANITDVFWITSPDLKVIHYISPGYELIWGRSAESLYANAHQWVECILPEERERVFAIFGTLTQNEPSVSVEYRIARADGTVRWVHNRGFQVRDAAGKLVRLTGIVTDITERKRVEETVRRSQAELRVLFDLVPAMIWFKDTENGILRVNKQVAETIGKSVDEIEGKPSFEIYPKEAAKFYADDLEVIRSGVPKLGIVENLPDREGKELWVQTDKVPYCDKDGKVIGIVVMAQNITERKRAEEALRESEERFSGAFMQAPIGVALVSPDGHWLKVNQALCDLVGYSEDELLTRTFQDITYPEDLEVSRENVRQLIAGEIRSFQAEKRYAHKSGHLITALLSVSLVRNGQGQPHYLIAQIQDITKRKQLEAQLIQSQKMETVGKLAGGIAHEFNSILTAIIGRSELLLSDLPSASPSFTNAIAIRKAADLAAALTQQLLAYGRKQILRSETLNLNQILSSMESMVRHLMGSEVNVRIVTAVGLPMVKTDAGQIEQVIMNIAINARDAMRHGGKLTMETSLTTLDEEYVRRFPELKAGDYVMLAISDTGAGMNEEVKSHLFEPFFTTKGVGEGTGLGLAMCQGIIKQSGGHINVYSELGRGTTFKIYLPQVEQGTKVPTVRPASPDLPRGTETILLVEDDPSLREMASLLLQRLGYVVLVAANGFEALNLTRHQDTGHIHLLFTDVVMPQMDGKDLSDRVKATHPKMKILFTSAYTETAIAHQGVLDPGVSLLQKPFTPAALAAKVRELLDA
jgi:PAS domain S-box-containing protein